MKKTKNSLLHSVIAFLLCISMLIGTTFAWFSDKISSSHNIITTGNLDLEMYWTDDLDSGKWYNVEKDGHNTVFSYDNWEPGYTDVKYIKLVNAGKLALNYKLSLTPENGVGKLAEVINVYYAEGGVDVKQRSDLQNLKAIGLLHNVLNGGATADGTLLAAEQYSPLHPSGEVIMTVALNMLTTAGNEYQNEDAGKFSITALATQAPFEEDSFGKDYDANAEYPVVLKGDSAVAPVTPVNGKVPAGGVTLSGSNISAFVPEGTVLEAGADKLTLKVTPLEKTTSDIIVVNNEILIPVDVHIDGVAESNTVPIIVNLGEILPKYLNMGNYHLYHVENGTNSVMKLVADASALTAHNTFTYDPLTGAVSVAMANFSEVTVVADTAAKWEGKRDYTWYNANGTELTIANADQFAGLSAIVGGMDGQTQDSFSGKTIKLLSDINLNHGTVLPDEEDTTTIIFYPVGYYNSEGTYDRTGTKIASGFQTFEGTFDGAGHTISNIYQNTWEMKGDHDWYAPEDQYYRDGMGLFGKVYGGAIKNLTVDNFKSDGEITTTGVIASYADFGATFENIAITNCNPRVYNIGNGGIVGCVGWYTKDATDKVITFKNITIDNSNMISALWGSYDVACGGIVGQYYPTSGQTSVGSPKNAGIHFENCHVAAQMDVYNDVCGNYQYYAYRYAGILMGSVRENETINGHVYPKMDGITAKDCTVHFGTWNDYYYCEYEKNGHPSYSGPNDYKFSRIPHSELNFTDSDQNGKINSETERESVKGCKHNHTVAEDNQAVYLPFKNLVTGYGWGVTSKAVGEMEGVTILDRLEGNSYIKFVKADTVKDGYTSGTEVFIGELFKAADIDDEKLHIKDGKVQVTVSPVDESSTAGGIFVGNVDDWTKGTLKFTGTGDAEIIITDYYFCKETKITVTIKDGGFLYRVGNKNSVTKEQLSKLLTSKESNNVEVVKYLTTEQKNWEIDGNKNTIKFNDTGVVEIKIDGKSYYLEVVDAKNYPSPSEGADLNATANNVVLLESISASQLKVSNGHTFCGNGFGIKFDGDGDYRSAALSYGFVTLEKSGTLDNTRVICNVFPKSYMFTNEMTVGTDGRYPYGYSAIIMSDNSIVSNCYVYGARNNILVSAGDALITNTVTECGSLSNIQVLSSSSNTVTLDDVTTIQYPTTSPFDTSAKVLGFGVVVGLPDSTSNANIKLTGDFVQHNWVTANDAENVDSTYTQSAVNGALDVAKYQHFNANSQKTVNTGIAYMNKLECTIVDERTNTGIVYEGNNVTISGYTGYVYSVVNKTGNPNAEVNDGQFENGVVVPKVVYNKEQNDNIKFETTFDTHTNRWLNTLTLDLDTIGSYIFEFKYLVVNKNGVNLSYKVKDADGKEVDNVAAITLNQLHNAEYTLVVTDDQIYDANGKLTGKCVEKELVFIIHATKTSIEPPKFNGIGKGTAIKTHEISGLSANWRPAYRALENVSVTYWSANEGAPATVLLTNLNTKGTINANVWTYTCDDYTLTITGGQVHTDGSKISPKVVDDELFFWSADKAFGTNTTSRNIILTYTFTDKNASTTKELNMSVKFDDLKYHKKSEFDKGILTEGEDGGSCFTPDTLITLADGSQKRVDEVNDNDKVLAWDFFAGTYVEKEISLLVNHGEALYKVANLKFSDNSMLRIIAEHGIFDYDLNKFVYITVDNMNEYIGHRFVKCAADGSYNLVTLEEAYETEEYTSAWSISSAETSNAFASGLLTVAPPEDFYNWIEMDEKLHYDVEQFQKDVATYGLYTYEDFKDYVTYEQFVEWNGAYLKIAVEKGHFTFEYILELIEMYKGWMP